MKPTRAYIGLGSNLDQPIKQVTGAFAELDEIGQTRCVARSALYRSEAIGPAQPDYVNAAAALDTELDAYALLRALQNIETLHQRVRSEHWGPRTLDLDLLLFGRLICDDRGLTLPHPHMHERVFVLLPLRDIAPDLIVPGLGSLDRLLASCPPLKIERFPA